MYQQPSRLIFRCKLREGKTTKLRDLGMGYFSRQRDAQGNWDGWTWQLKTLDYVVSDIPYGELPLIKEGAMISPAIIERRKNGKHKIACRVLSPRQIQKRREEYRQKRW